MEIFSFIICIHDIENQHILMTLIIFLLKYFLCFIKVVDIYPPCTTSSVIEKHAVESLVDSSVVSYHDGQECETHEASRKLAKHLDLDFEEDFNSDWVPVTRPEIIVYVNVENLLSRKWISNIATSLLEIY